MSCPGTCTSTCTPAQLLFEKPPGLVLDRSWAVGDFLTRSICTCLSKFLIWFTSIKTVHIQYHGPFSPFRACGCTVATCDLQEPSASLLSLRLTCLALILEVKQIIRSQYGSSKPKRFRFRQNRHPKKSKLAATMWQNNIRNPGIGPTPSSRWLTTFGTMSKTLQPASRTLAPTFSSCVG